MTLTAPLAPADATTAFQSALGACGSGKGGRGEHLIVPAGTYRISNTLRVQNVNGIGILGMGGKTRLSWNGPADRPLLLLQDVRQSRFADFTVTSSPVTPLLEGVRMENASGGVWSPAFNQFENVTVDGTNTGGLDKGWQLALGTGGDANNDFHTFTSCFVNYATTAAWSLEATQEHCIQFFNCYAYGGERGVAASLNAGSGGHFQWRGGFIGSMSVTAFETGNTVGLPDVIEGLSCEGCARLLVTGGPSGAPLHIALRDIRFASNGLDPDGKVIIYKHPGVFEMSGCSIGDTSSKALAVEWNPITPESVAVVGYLFSVRSCHFRSSLATPEDLFLTRTPSRLEGVSIRSAAGVNTTP